MAAQALAANLAAASSSSAFMPVPATVQGDWDAIFSASGSRAPTAKTSGMPQVLLPPPGLLPPGVGVGPGLLPPFQAAPERQGTSLHTPARQLPPVVGEQLRSFFRGAAATGPVATPTLAPLPVPPEVCRLPFLCPVCPHVVAMKGLYSTRHSGNLRG
jgi:hypothetical protein